MNSSPGEVLTRAGHQSDRDHARYNYVRFINGVVTKMKVDLKIEGCLT